MSLSNREVIVAQRVDHFAGRFKLAEGRFDDRAFLRVLQLFRDPEQRDGQLGQHAEKRDVGHGESHIRFGEGSLHDARVAHDCVAD